MFAAYKEFEARNWNLVFLKPEVLLIVQIYDLLS